MRYLSICSGIEAASIAWEPLGWTPAGFAEIDRFPSAVLAHHWPHVPNFGDFTTIRSDDAGPVDLIVGGTPCQSFSVAGLRKGLDDERGNLALEFCLLVSRLRPRWILWENVPGVLSMEGGEAFASILGGLVQCGYGVAYRVLDAQFFGLAQRRKRVFVVGHIGDWRRAAAVLFERESLSRNSPPRREAREGTAPAVAPSLTSGGKGRSGGVGDFRGQDALVAIPETDVVGTLSDGAHMGGGLNGQDAYSGRILPVAFDTTQVTSKANRSNPKAGDPCHSYVAQCVGALNANDGAPRQLQSAMSDHLIGTGWAVRRLTPRECERLQGFPDDFTRIPYRGKSASECPDGPRYKALGNSFAVPVVRWIGERIAAVDAIQAREKAA